jgi:hypothetical protein
MASLFFTRFIKTLLVATPFLSMILMVLALWGVGGKTTYTDLNITKQQIQYSVGEAKNIMVNETKNNELPQAQLKQPEVCVGAEKSEPPKQEPLPEKIEWGHVV